MKKLFKILISAAATLIVFGSFAGITFAQTPDPLTVIFEKTPLFEGINFVPGDGMSRAVQVINNALEKGELMTKASNFASCSGYCLADALTLTITDESKSYFSGTLRNFYDAGEVSLGDIDGNGASKIFTYTVFFSESFGNDFQNKSTGFDLVVGFKGGETVVSDSPTFIAVGGGGGGGSGSRHLFIFNERNEDVPPEMTTATVSWNTNIPATSQVIYGLSDGNYVLNLENLPYFGYPAGTAEDTAKVVNHTVVLSDLIPGKTYKYRVVSRASPPTISYEHEFTVPASAATIATNQNAGEEDTLEISENNDRPASSTIGEIAGASDQNAAVIASGLRGFSWWWLLILLVIAICLIWRIFFKRKG